MNKPELKEKVNKSFQLCQDMLGDTGEFVPMIEIMYTDNDDKKNGTMMVLMGQNKHTSSLMAEGMGVIMGAIKRLNKIKGVDCVVMMSEMYFVIKKKTELVTHAPSEDPDKQEGLVVCGMTEDGILEVIMKGMIKVEVKGKTHFSFTDFPMGEIQKGDSIILDAFFEGYKKAISTDNEQLNTLFAGAPALDTLTPTKMIEIASQEIGKMMDSKVRIINKNKE